MDLSKSDVSHLFEQPGSTWSPSDRSACVRWLFDRRRNYLLACILHCLGSVASAEDAEDAWSQFCLYQLSSVIDAYDPAKGEFEQYLVFCLKRSARRHWTQQRRCYDRERPLDPMDLTASGQPPAIRVPGPRVETVVQARDLISKALSALPDPYATVLVRCDLVGELQGDVARAMRRRPATIRTWLYRARQRMKAEIRSLEDEVGKNSVPLGIGSATLECRRRNDA